MTPDNSYDVVIVGAGAVGAAAAFHSARRGLRALLVEQHELGHKLGSSHGAARITRYAYRDKRYTALMREAYSGWAELETLWGRTLYLKTGGLTVAAPDVCEQIAEGLRDAGIPFAHLSREQAELRHPAFRIGPGRSALFEPTAGALAADEAIRAQVELFRAAGGQVRERAAVSAIYLDGTRPVVDLSGEKISADAVIVAAGPWTPALVPQLAPLLSTTRQEVTYFAAPGAGSFAPERFPVFIFRLENQIFYGMPSLHGHGVKVARDEGVPEPIGSLKRTVSDEYVDEIRGFLRSHLPALAEAECTHRESCVYTMTEDEHFLVGALPGDPRVAIASACSGHGFKFSNLVGRLLAELVMDGRASVDISLWEPERAICRAAERTAV